MIARYCPVREKLQEKSFNRPTMPTPTQRSFWLRYRGRIIALYALALVLSWTTQAWFHSAPKPVAPPASHRYGTPLLLLVDPLTPRSAEGVLDAVRPRVAEGTGLRAPVLPGLNAPAARHPTFQSLAEDLPVSDVPEIVVANGNAGAVALHLAALRPDRVAALVLVDASGVQEYAMLGEYHLNYALYAVSDLLVTAAHRLIPHFGAWDSLRLRKGQIDLLRRSDRRRLRPLFRDFDSPALIVDYTRESTYPSPGGEHARLLPQSHRIHVAGNPELAHTLHDFLDRLSLGEAPRRAQADPARAEAARASFDPDTRPRPRGLHLALFLLGIALATLVTEDLTCAITGLMIANGNLTWLQGFGACLFGILFGDYLLFLAGRHWGRAALNKIPLRWMIDPLALRETEQWYKERAGRAILISRCIPGTRLPTYVAAGVLGVPAKIFAFWFVVAALLWTPLFLATATLLAEQALEWLDRYHHIAPALALLGLLIYFVLTHLLLPCFSWRGRRRILGRWQRLRRSEYWPTPAFYAPVVVYLGLRALKRGNRLMDFTACNPCIPGSGVVEESKSHILDQIDVRDMIADYIVIAETPDKDARLRAATTWMDRESVPYPVVVKPDVGQRGEDVSIAREETALRQNLALIHGDVILQRFCPGKEFGIFYIRPPAADKGFIFGITRKALPVVIGDGTHNLEDLILADSRTVCQADVFLRQHADTLYTVPAAGETVQLSQIGNHGRGTLFEEGAYLATPELAAAIERVAGSMNGFYFGRFDLFAPDEEHLRRGEGLRIIELNGVTSESTNLYDPGKSYVERVKILLRQWRYACAIGREQRIRGTRILPFRLMLRHYDRYRKRRHRQRIQQARISPSTL